ncbi:MAG: radical SAM family heme chaperone HemW [Flavobacteriales bacterium]|nr:radical SAM family heme chaperone HemW [Flavobacteriales bacterium]
MAGLYLHIPFCKQACTYCDFHFSTSLGQRDRVMSAILKEIAMRAPEANGAGLGSIYLGGGTPSVVGTEALENLLRTIAEHFTITGSAEVTIEANPDDVTVDALRQWKDLGITRVSLGIQSFRDDRLKWMGRAHDAAQARRSIELISTTGFASWTIDLIYGLPGMTTAEWDEQLALALDHRMPHLSAYCLTVEKGTALEHQVRKGLVTPAADDAQATQFDHLVARMESAGLVQYEISNFGREGHFAAHNSSYWKGVPYIGVGPSAHSFDGIVRRWNVANNVRYAEALETGTPFWEEEMLSHGQRVNERLMTGLRTIWGVDLRTLGDDVRTRENRTIVKYQELGDLVISGDRLLLTPKGRRYADRIASDLFLTGEDGGH